MLLAWEIIARFTIGGGQRRFTRFVALASLLGMMLGVAALIVVLSVMNGFAAELQQRLLSVAPDLVLEPAADALGALDALERDIANQPGVVAATRFHSATVLLRTAHASRGVALTGAPEEGLASVLDLETHLIAGSLAEVAFERFSVVLGADLARLLRVRPGDDVEVVLPRLTLSPMGAFSKTRKLRVVGLFEVGATPDINQAYVSLDTASRLLGAVGQRGVQARLADRELVYQQGALQSWLREVPATVSDWRSSQGSLFAAIKMEKITVGLLLTSVILVAAFNLVSMLTMSVTEKRGDIATLQVLGLSVGRLLMIFLGHGLLLAAIGITAGAGVGVLVASSVSELSAWLEQVTGWVLFDPAVYYIGGLPARLMASDVVIVVVSALLLSIMASVYPAWRASRVPPAEALNYV